MRRLWLPLWAIFSLFLWTGSVIAQEAQETEETATEDEMVVTATRIPVQVSEAPGTVHVITRKEIEDSPGMLDMAEFLSLYFGVQVNSSGTPGGVSSIGLRGAGSEQVLVMINGVPMVNPQNGNASLSFLNLDMVDRIEVIQGPLSSLYGEDALGGVINIITGCEPGGNIRLGSGTHDSNDLHLTYGWEAGGLGLGAADTDGHRINSDYKGDWQFGYVRPELLGWQLDLGFYHYRDEKGLPGTVAYPSEVSRGEDAQRVIYATAKRSTEKLETVMRLYRVGVQSDFNDEFSVAEHDAYRAGAEAQVSWRIKPELSVLTVGKWEETGVDSTSVGEKEGTSRSLAAQLAWTPLDSLYVYAGDHLSHHSVYGTNHSPRLSVVYRKLPGLVLKGMYSEAFRAPTFNELYWPADSYSHGNPDLQPEKGRTLEVGMEYQFLERCLLKISAYQTKVANLIEWLPEDDGDSDPWNDPWSPQNHGKVRMNGVDLSLSLKPASNWNIAGQLHLLDAKAQDELSGDYNKLETKTPVSGAIGVFYRMNRLYGAGFVRYFHEHGDLPSFAIADLNLRYAINPSASVLLGIENLFDRDYAFNPGYPMPGLTLRIGFDLLF
jgi:outer membrane cobalamin receptor